MNGETEKPELISKISKFLPAVEKPIYKQSFNSRLKWTGLALLMYFVLSYITIYGISPTSYEQFRFFEIVLGSKFGSLMTLGIGPIVTAGIILQLLVGSKILNWDTTKPEGRKKFQLWNKLLAIGFSFLEAIAFVLAGALGEIIGGPLILIFVILQLAAGGIIVILLDDLVSKWGFGSGVSLFIAAGVTTQIVIRAISPLGMSCVAGNLFTCIPSAENPPTGLIWSFFLNALSGNTLTAIADLMPLIFTVVVFLLVVYAQHICVDVPLAFSALRGFGRTWSLKLFYTSNIPVIFAAALIANLQLMGRIGAVPVDNGLTCGILGCFDQQGPVSGIVYYLSSPTNLLLNVIGLTLTSSELIRAFTYLIFLSVFAMIFSIFWVNTAGMDAKSVSTQIESIGLQIPGFRRDPRIIESVLNRYIPALAVLGGLAVGMLAAFADFTGALGTGTGILLTVMIVYNYYEELGRQNLEEAHPLVRKVFGE